MNQIIHSVHRMLVIATLSVTIAMNVQAATEAVHINPAPGEVSELSEFVISFDGEWSLGSKRSAKFTVTGPEGVTIPPIMSYSLGASVGYCVYFDDDAVLTTPGQYTLTVPAGKFAIDNVELGEMTFEYTIVEGNEPHATFPDCAILPAPGTYTSIADGFTLRLDTEEEITVDESGISLNGPNETTYSLYVDAPRGMSYIIVAPVDANNDVIALTNPGQYTLVFAERTIKVGDVSNSHPLVYTYTLLDGSHGIWDGAITSVPEDGSTVKSLKDIAITFEGAQLITVSGNATPDMFPVLKNLDTNETVGATIYANENVLEVSIQREVTDNGHYELIIKGGLLSVDGNNLLDNITLSYTILNETETVDYTYTVAPDNGNLGLSEPITITFAAEGLKSVENNVYAWGKNMPYFTNDSGYENPNLQVIKTDDFTYKFIHEWPFTKNGKYTFVIPSNYFTFTLDNDVQSKNSAISIEFNVGMDGIITITNDGAETCIYSINGVQITGDKENTLPAGIYVINGNKVIVK